ncbi:18439_t:CDS:2 [Rhizophagus irregularis]|nr:18439_t:CDS:2 [Rhizophagus irregularis]
MAHGVSRLSWATTGKSIRLGRSLKESFPSKLAKKEGLDEEQGHSPKNEA